MLGAAAGVALGPGEAPSTAFDATPPIIPLAQVMPAGHGNTVYSSQPLSASITDAGSGVDPRSITFVLRDLTARTTRTLAAASFSHGVAVTAPAGLVAGHTYSVAVSAADWSGHRTTADQGMAPSQGFLAIRESIGQEFASIPSSPGVLDNSGSSVAGMRTATFRHVLLDLGDASVALSGTQHTGFGYIESTVSLRSVQVCTAAAGGQLCRPAYSARDPQWAPRVVASQFAANRPSPAGAVRLRVGGIRGLDLGSLTVQVPAAWRSATLTMAPAAASAASPTCASPADASAVAGCSTDPVRFSLSDGASEQAQSLVDRTFLGMHAAAVNLPEEVPLYYLSVRVLSHYRPVAASPVSPSHKLASTGPVAYPNGYPALYSVQYASFCAITQVCFSPDALNNQPPISFKYPGYDCSPDQNGCEMVVLRDNLTYAEPSCCPPCTSCPVGGPRTHRYFGDSGTAYGCKSDGQGSCNFYGWGFPDSDGTDDGVGIGWAGSWAFNFYTTDTVFGEPFNSGCQTNTVWYEDSTGFSYQSGGNVDTVAVPNYQNQDYLAWEHPNEIWFGCGGSTVQYGLIGFGVAADEVEGQYHGDPDIEDGEQADLNGLYVHAWTNTSWHFEFEGCSTDRSCTVTFTSSQTTETTPYDSTPSRYDY